MDCDVLIVGGGVAGLSLAWRLSPSRSVVLVEAEGSLAYHTSSRSARQMQPSYGPAAIQELTRRSIAMVEGISERLPAPIMVPRAMLTLGTETEVAALVAANANLESLTHSETMERSPDLRPETFEASALDGTAMEVDVPALLEFYRRQAIGTGAMVLTGAPVTAVEVVASEPAGGTDAEGAGAEDLPTRFHVTAGRHSITAGTVVDAAGAWADVVAAQFGARPRGLQPHRRSVAIVSTEHPVDPSGPMVEPADESFYYRPDGTHLLISPCESVPAEPGDAQVVDEDIAELIHRIGEVTTVGITGVERSWTGLRTQPADGLPVVGFDADVPNLFWLAGQGGYGIQTSAALATLAAGLLTGTLPDDDGWLAGALSPQRAGLG
ncbi:D-arginine dehydrogenase [Arthrobacter silviterrae]|uniref:FAD-binding oxidoreductase n=1 Tax=Arthrobacter silviterrae TaxID=2026658 RepID=A0ABX0DCC9_9MICC|nr:FAD-dependent oxidoreductase [Arthrobacter silviterrae]MDQ0279466.1 D-arginine dehydrogenase [Arthrobacter silviterrae]NGN82055.1 FAD-binding oxidoreductase [Arthrobacter silviterrae]